MKILFIVIPEKGHINPYIGVAQHLQEKGHELAFYAPHDISHQLEAAGLYCFLGETLSGPPSDKNRGRFFANQISDKEWLRSWIKELLVENAPGQVPRLQEVIQDFKPALVVTDPMVYPAAVASELEGVKWIAISNSLNPVLNKEVSSELLDTVAWLDSERKEFFRTYGLQVECRGCDMISPHMTMAFTTCEFIGRDVADIELVGPSVPLFSRGDEREFPWDQLMTDRPTIYMSLGSQIYYQPEIFRTVFEAVRGKQVQLIVTAYELMESDELGDVPDNVLPVYYTPQLQLLPKVDAMITHGGANSVMEALQFGVPLLISPICNDQFHQVYFIEQAGVGCHLDLETCSPQSCWDAIELILEDHAIRKNVDHISKSYQVDGARRAAHLIDNFLVSEAQSN